MTDLRITVANTSSFGGTALTPFWFGLHDGSFDVYEGGTAASDGLEAIAEDGTTADIAAELIAADADGQGGVVAGVNGPIDTQEVASALVRDVDGSSNGSISLAAMVLPSNDAFVATESAVALFGPGGRFAGAQTLVFEGTDVLDAGTELNTEEDAAFLNQSAPDTGVDENGVVQVHGGFNGSLGNPDGTFGFPAGQAGAENILGGTNAFGNEITEEADFTRPGAQIAEVHINTFVETALGNSSDIFLGKRADDLVTAGGGRDVVFGRGGYDELDLGAGSDVGLGGNGRDILLGGGGADTLFGGAGDDMQAGGLGDDHIFVIAGNDTILFATGDGNDTVVGFRDGDVLALDIDGLSFADVAAAATTVGRSTEIDLGGGDSITLRGVEATDLTESDFIFL